MIWYFGFSPYVMLLAPSIYCFFFLAESRSFRLCAATKLHCSSDSTWDTCYTWWMQCGAKLQTLGSQCQVDWNRSVETPWAGKSILSTLHNALPVFFASVAATSLNQKSLSAKEPQIPIDWTLRAAIETLRTDISITQPSPFAKALRAECWHLNANWQTSHLALQQYCIFVWCYQVTTAVLAIGSNLDISFCDDSRGRCTALAIAGGFYLINWWRGFHQSYDMTPSWMYSSSPTLHRTGGRRMGGIH